MREIFRVLAIALVCLAFTGIVFGKSSSSITLTSPVNPSPYGSSVTFTATVTPIAVTGTVTFKDGSTTLGTGTISSGAATYITSKLTVASHSITASYGGNSLYDSSLSPTLTQTVSPASTTVTLTSFANPSSYGSSVTSLMCSGRLSRLLQRDPPLGSGLNPNLVAITTRPRNGARASPTSSSF